MRTQTMRSTHPVAQVVSSAFNANFASNESPFSDGGKYQRGLAEGLVWNDPKTVSGRCTATIQSSLGVNRGDDTICHVKTGTRAFTANKYAQGTVGMTGAYFPPGGAKHENELLLRWDITANNARGYEILWGMDGNVPGQAYIAVVRWNGAINSFDPIFDPGVGSIAVPTDGDVLYAQIVGNILTVKRNGVNVSGLSALDVTSIGGTTWNSGQPGFGFWPVDGATPASYGWKAWQADDL